MKNLNRQLDKQRKCLSRASEKSAKASDLTRSLVFAGFGLIWVILQADKLDIKNWYRSRIRNNYVVYSCDF